MIVDVALLLVIVVGGTFGEMCVTRAMKIIGEVKDFSPRSLVRTGRRAFKVWWMWLGFVLMALSYFALLGMLAREAVSFVIPVTSLGYVVGAIGGRWFLGEDVSYHRWVGVVLVCFGVYLIYAGRS
jgi:multidrug transporter EmrE-like cation transporter